MTKSQENMFVQPIPAQAIEASGFVRSYASVAKLVLLDNLIAHGVWGLILHGMARHRDVVRANRTVVSLEPGQLVFNVAAIAESTGIGRRKIDEVIKMLVEHDFIATTKGTYGLLITVRHYCTLHGSNDAERKTHASTAQASLQDALPRHDVSVATEDAKPALTLEVETLSQLQKPPVKRRRTKAPLDEQGKIPADEGTELRRLTWIAYRTAYIARYSVEPLRDARANVSIKHFCARVGSASPAVIDHFVRSANPWYLQNCHPLSAAVRDAQALFTTFSKGISHVSLSEARREELFTKNVETLNRASERDQARAGTAPIRVVPQVKAPF